MATIEPISSTTSIEQTFQKLKSELKSVRDGSMGKIRGFCNHCDEPIKEADEITYALGKAYHSPHFVCSVCSENVANTGYVLHENKIQCENCYASTNLPKCHRCSKPIKSAMLNVKDRPYHPECLVCYVCSTSLAGQSIIEKDNQLVCRKCYDLAHAPECARCKLKISKETGKAEYLVVNGKKYHMDCFTCFECGKKFEDKKALSFGDKLVCKKDFEILSKNNPNGMKSNKSNPELNKA